MARIHYDYNQVKNNDSGFYYFLTAVVLFSLLALFFDYGIRFLVEGFGLTP